MIISDVLDQGLVNAKNVNRFFFGSGAIQRLPELVLERKRVSGLETVVYFVDSGFADKAAFEIPGLDSVDLVIPISTEFEPTTEYVNHLLALATGDGLTKPAAVIGIGGGSTLDIAKAISNLLNNPGRAEDYQGWDLVRNPGVYKIGVPTLSGTGAEATRTCVMTNKSSGLKLGMNSDYSVFDQLILDPALTATVPRNQYFWTGMDAFIHCVESLAGGYRNPIGDTFSSCTLELCREVFLSDDMQADRNREKLMVASYLGGSAVGFSYVGLIHPLSAALSVVFGTPHCLANCIVMGGVSRFYPEACDEFQRMVAKQEIEVPQGLFVDLSEDQFDNLYKATMMHEKPLINALGRSYGQTLTKDLVKQMFKAM